jgi:hypothetical protein
MTFLDEVVDEWEKRTGKSRELLEEMLRIHADYIYEKTVEDPNAYRINLPSLGLLNFNFFASNTGTKMHSENEMLLRKIQSKRISLIKNFTNDEVNFLEPQCYTYERKATGRRPKRSYFKMKDMYDKMAQKSNQHAEKCYSE